MGYSINFAQYEIQAIKKSSSLRSKSRDQAKLNQGKKVIVCIHLKAESDTAKWVWMAI